MSTNQSTIDYLLDQLTGAGEVRARKMFGEYALYCNDKVVALVCDEQLFVKITPVGKEYIGNHYQEGRAYPSAKPSMLINEELIEDRVWLQELIRMTADALPLPRPKVSPPLRKATARQGKSKLKNSNEIMKKNIKGFTMMEILVVVAIIGVFATLALVFFGGVTVGARDTKRMSDINQIGRFLSFGCLTPAGGPGEYDLNDLIDEYKIKYPQYANNIPKNIRDPKIGTDLVSNYKYIVSADNKCVLYANLEDEEAEVSLPALSEPTPGGGKGVLLGTSAGGNNSNKYFQVSN